MRKTLKRKKTHDIKITNEMNEMRERMDFNEKKMELMSNKMEKMRNELNEIQAERNYSKWVEDDMKEQKPHKEKNIVAKNIAKKKKLKPAVVIDMEGNLDNDATRVENQPIDWTWSDYHAASGKKDWNFPIQ